MKTKIKFGFLVLSFCFSSVALAAFTDVNDSAPYAEAISYVESENIVSGYPDGTFGPDKSINRAEFTKIVISASFSPETIEICTLSRFVDVDEENDWFLPYVCTATENDIVGGYPDGTFRPGRNINLAEASKIILKSFGHTIATGDDVWFRPFIEGLAERNAIPTTIQDYDSFLTRGEMAEIIYRLKTESTDQPSMAYSGNGLVQKSTPPIEPSDVTETVASEESEDDSTEETETETTEQQEDETTTTETAQTTTEEDPTEETSSSETTETTETEEDTSESQEPVTTSTGANVSYTSYSDTLLESGLNDQRPIALFFHADWCPTCTALDQEISDRLSELPDNSLILKIDFDERTDLRSKYKVTQQHTAILFNSEGQKAKSIGLSFEDLKSVLQ